MVIDSDLFDDLFFIDVEFFVKGWFLEWIFFILEDDVLFCIYKDIGVFLVVYGDGEDMRGYDIVFRLFFIVFYVFVVKKFF